MNLLPMDIPVLVQERVKLGCQSLAGFEVFFDFRFLSLIKRTVDWAQLQVNLRYGIT
jgi:hypothetical protein